MGATEFDIVCVLDYLVATQSEKEYHEDEKGHDAASIIESSLFDWL